MIDKCLILNPTYTEALNSQALNKLFRFDTKATKHFLKKSLVIDPTYEPALCNLSIVPQIDGDKTLDKHFKRKTRFDNNLNVNQIPVTGLFPMGRSGSLFLHSLLDGHPEILTIPGVYLKSWFASDTWKKFQPDYSEEKWRETLVKKIISVYEPVFDARVKKNVPGTPMEGEWIAKSQGFTNMGPNGDQVFFVSKEVFSQKMLDLLNPLKKVNHKKVFELIHFAFSECFQKKYSKNTHSPKQIFYHIHNPTTDELEKYTATYPNARQLLIVRDPIVALESHMNISYPEQGVETDKLATLVKHWGQLTNIKKMFFSIFYIPYVNPDQWRGVRLEDLKSKSHETLEKLARWMGITFDESLLQSTFCDYEYWGPSRIGSPIKGFDKTPLRQQKGALFGPRDIEILETLLLPFSQLYGYSEVPLDNLKANLERIQPFLDEPFEYEERLFLKKLPKSLQLTDIVAYHGSHNLLKFIWNKLYYDGKYPNIIPPLK